MKYLKYLVVVSLVAGISLPVFSLCASTPSLPPLPQVPITYPGDTDQTIARRAGWVEAAKKEGKLVWWGTRHPDEAQRIMAEFNKIYPFIKLNHWRGTAYETAAKAEAEFIAGYSTADILQGAQEYNHPRWRQMDLLDKFADIIPGIKKLDKRLYSKYGDWVLGQTTVIVPAYNNKLVSASEAPKSWEDLLNPKWKGQIGLTTSMAVWSTLALVDGGWGIDKTEKFLTKLREQDLMWGTGHTASLSLMIAGEFKNNAEAFLHHVLQFKEKGAPVEWVRVNPVPVTGFVVLLPKKAPHPHAAKLFLEWLFSPQGSIVYEKVVNAGLVFPGSGTRQAKAAEGLNLVVRTEETLLKIIELRLDGRFAKILGVTP